MTIPPQVLADPLPAEPLALAQRWLEEAWSRREQPNPNAMVVATIDADGRPAARVVLCKDISPQPGLVSFFTNYESRKGRALDANPRIAAVLHWDHMHRQVRIEGRVVRASAADSDAYFASRAWQSRIGAWASQQSAPVASRAVLQRQLAEAAARFSVPAPGADPAPLTPDPTISRPGYWGGYHLWADAVELWVEGEARLHDRARWTRELRAGNADSAWSAGAWTVTRLQP